MLSCVYGDGRAAVSTNSQVLNWKQKLTKSRRELKAISVFKQICDKISVEGICSLISL